MRRYLLILSLGALQLWGGLYLATLGGNQLLGRRAIPQALQVTRERPATYKIAIMGREVAVGKAVVLGKMTEVQRSKLFSRLTKLRLRVPVGRLDLLIEQRNRRLGQQEKRK